ncbi:hypothetical protein [Vaginisenegalia massiliensis]|uniref:hypothetical protein n=1 Tax=Vaginisenegalia massiliensis TaxID=2058294 RepID=UPI000F54699A|nr:hypothetical protein [Vaginisenegalia massiliensis]
MTEFFSELSTLFINHMMEAIVASFFIGIGWIFNKGVKAYREHLEFKEARMSEESTEQDLIKQGVLSLLRFRINRICKIVKENGEMTLDEKQDLDDMMKAYANLGGNGRTKMLYEEIIKLKIKL